MNKKDWERSQPFVFGGPTSIAQSFEAEKPWAVSSFRLALLDKPIGLPASR